MYLVGLVVKKYKQTVVHLKIMPNISFTRNITDKILNYFNRHCK
jgi:hypothetical protein